MSSSCFIQTWLLSPRTLSLTNHNSPRVSFSPIFARPRNNNTPSLITNNKKFNKKKNTTPVKKKVPLDNAAKDDDLDEDAFEALFSQLEEDLKNDGFSLEDFDEDMSEADLAQLELELAEALGDDEMLGSSGSLPVQKVSNDAKEDGDGDDDEDEDKDADEDEEEDKEEEKEEEDLSNLKTWQLRRLAYAFKDGKRKTSIKNLAADVCLDRSLVLKLLRDPPPSLLLMSASLPDKPTPVISEPEQRPTEETGSLETASENLPEPDTDKKIPIHDAQSNWSAQKRLKKVQRDTLERVYNRTKRPTNTIVSSIVHVTNLPRKKVVKWFEDRRAEDGVPDQRRPYQREAAATESVVN